MKKYIGLAAILAIMFGAVSLASANQKPQKAYVGVGVMPFYLDGLQNATLSDRAYYPNNEARVYLPLADANTDGAALLPGILFGYAYDLAGPVTANGEISVHLYDRVAAFTAMIGGDMFVVNKPNMKIGIPLRVGFLGALIDFGQTELVQGSTPPVILPEGSINTGDDLGAQMMGAVVRGGMTAELWLTPKLGLRADVGAQMGFLGKLEIKATKAGSIDCDSINDASQRAICRDTNETVIPVASPDVVVPNTNTPTDMKPEGGSLGISAYLGLVFKL